MALSVLQLPFQPNKNVCGVWCSVKQDWIHKGNRENCHSWKHIEEEKEEEVNREKWRKEFIAKGYINFHKNRKILNNLNQKLQ